MAEKGFRRLPDGRVEIDLTFIKPGTILAWPTFDNHNEMVHLAYRPYTAEEIAELINKGNRHVYYTRQEEIRSQYNKDVQEYLDKETYKGPRTIKLETQKKAVSAMREIVQFISAGKIADFDDAKRIVEYVLDDIHTSKDEVVNLLDIQNYDDYTYTHSLNVGVISMVLAKRMNVSEQVMFNVGLAGFLHDIGKIVIPSEVLNKPGRLTQEEFEIIRTHPRQGYEMVKNAPQVNDAVRRMILFHHERANGSGYPLGLTYEKLGNLPFVISIADFYDALTTARSYKKALPPHEVLKIIMKQSISHFPEKVVQRFMADMKMLLKESSFYEVGMYVLLNTQEIARVVEKDNKYTTRPVLEILKNSRGEVNKKPVRVDLNYDGSRNIIKILEDEQARDLSLMFPVS